MNLRNLAYDVSKWAVILALTIVLAISSAWVKGDVYTKSEIDTTIQRVEREHDQDMNQQQHQLDRIDDNVQRLVDRLIAEGQ